MKHKIAKNLIVALLTCGMLASSLSGCGNTDGAASNSSGSEASSVKDSGTAESGSGEVDSGETDEEVTEEPFADYPAFDMDGRTIKIAVFYDMYYDSNDTVPEDNPGVTSIEHAQKQLDNVRRVEQKYNVKIEYVTLSGDALKDSMNTSVVAGTPDYDVYLTQMEFGLPLAMNGYLEDLSDITAAYHDVNNERKVITPLDVVGTNNFFSVTSKNYASNYMVYNADMLTQLGLEDPNELWEKGEWTWDKFEELCIAATQDTDNDGVTDVYGYGGDVTYGLKEFLASNNAVLVKDDGTEGLTSNESLETFQFLSKLYNDDNAARPVTDDWNDNLYAWASGKVAFAPSPLWVIQTAGDINFNYRIVQWPVGPSGDGTQAGQAFADYWAIPKGVEEPEKVYQILEEFFGGATINDPEQDIHVAYEWIEACFTDESDLETCFAIGDMGNGDIWAIIDTDYIISSVFGSICTAKTMTPAQAIESHKQLFQDEIDKFLNPQ